MRDVKSIQPVQYNPCNVDAVFSCFFFYVSSLTNVKNKCQVYVCCLSAAKTQDLRRLEYKVLFDRGTAFFCLQPTSATMSCAPL